MRCLKLLVTTLAATVLLASAAQAGAFQTDVPAKVDPAKRYLIYLRGAWPETKALSEPHPKRGLFEYDKIVKGLAACNFEVILQLRREKTNPRRYARTVVVPQIAALIEKGVPANRITVAGFSKGGNMVLVLMALAKQSEVNFVNMAGCGKGRFRAAYDSCLANDAPKMQGEMLSLFDEA